MPATEVCDGSHVKYLLILSDFNENANVTTNFNKNSECEVLQKSVQWESLCSTWTDRRTNMTRLVVVFYNCTELMEQNLSWKADNR
jgi:hypothetical protein